MAKDIRINQRDEAPPGEDLESTHEPSREEIERRAYDLYQQRGAAPGQHLDDWLRAERELRELRERQQEQER